MSNDFSLLDWMKTGTIATRKVPHYNDQSAYSDYLDWERRYEQAEADYAAAEGERSMGEKNPLVALNAEGEKILERLQSSKAVFTIQAISDDAIDEINERHPLPPRPVDPPPNAAPVAREKFVRKLEAYVEQVSHINVTRDLEKFELAITTIETPNGTIHGTTAEELRKFLSVPHGRTLLDKFARAFDEAMSSEVTLPGKKSPTPSEDTQD